MKVLFLHGLESKPGGTKPSCLKKAGYDVCNPALPKNDFDISVKIAQDSIDFEKPDLVVGSSRGGAVAMSVSTRGAPLLLIAPAWKKYVKDLDTWKIRADATELFILHSENDDVIPVSESKELTEKYGGQLTIVGADHRMSDDDALEALLDSAAWLLEG